MTACFKLQHEISKLDMLEEKKLTDHHDTASHSRKLETSTVLLESHSLQKDCGFILVYTLQGVGGRKEDKKSS
jgi:hypothetical protein